MGDTDRDALNEDPSYQGYLALTEFAFVATLATAYDVSRAVKVLSERFQRDDLIATDVVHALDDCKAALGALKMDENGAYTTPREEVDALKLFDLNDKQTAKRPLLPQLLDALAMEGLAKVAGMDIEDCTSDTIREAITNRNMFIDEILAQLESDFEELEEDTMFASCMKVLNHQQWGHLRGKGGKSAQQRWFDNGDEEACEQRERGCAAIGELHGKFKYLASLTSVSAGDLLSEWNAIRCPSYRNKGALAMDSLEFLTLTLNKADNAVTFGCMCELFKALLSIAFDTSCAERAFSVLVRLYKRLGDPEPWKLRHLLFIIMNGPSPRDFDADKYVNEWLRTTYANREPGSDSRAHTTRRVEETVERARQEALSTVRSLTSEMGALYKWKKAPQKPTKTGRGSAGERETEEKEGDSDSDDSDDFDDSDEDSGEDSDEDKSDNVGGGRLVGGDDDDDDGDDDGGDDEYGGMGSM